MTSPMPGSQYRGIFNKQWVSITTIIIITLPKSLKKKIISLADQCPEKSQRTCSHTWVLGDSKATPGLQHLPGGWDLPADQEQVQDSSDFTKLCQKLQCEARSPTQKQQRQNWKEWRLGKTLRPCPWRWPCSRVCWVARSPSFPFLCSVVPQGL